MHSVWHQLRDEKAEGICGQSEPRTAMKKKTGHRNTWQISQFAYDTKYSVQCIKMEIKVVLLRVMCCLVRVVIQCITVHIVSRMYQGWWPGIATCRLWHRLLFGLVALCLFKKKSDAFF